MLAKVRAHLSYANVVSTLCLFILLGGGAWAAATINSKDVIDNSLKSADLKDEKGVKGEDVVPDSLSGGAIDESELSLLGSPVMLRTTVIPAATAQGQGTTRPEISSARCNEGEQLLGGGYGETTPSTTTTGLGDTYDLGFAGPGVVKPNPNFPGPGEPETLVQPPTPGETPDAYRFWMEVEGNADNPAVTVYAICTT